MRNLIIDLDFHEVIHVNICDLLKVAIDSAQTNDERKLYRVIPFSSCACNVCGSYTRFNLFPYKPKPPLNKYVNALHFHCTDL